MPAKSKKQFRFMEAILHNPKFAKQHDMAPSKAKEFVQGVDYKKLPESKK